MVDMVYKSKFTTYKNHRAEPYFSFVKNGEKTIESRVRRGKYRLVKSGDHIIVNNNEETESFEVVVKDVRNYKAFHELLENESLKKVMPDVKTVEEALKIIYERFYTAEEENKFGVVAIEVEKL